jgi:hypothetical protein
MINANQSEWVWRQVQWERLIAIMEEADAIQQRLLGDEDQEVCYEIHSQLSEMLERFEEFAAADEQYWTEEQ